VCAKRSGSVWTSSGGGRACCRPSCPRRTILDWERLAIVTMVLQLLLKKVDVRQTGKTEVTFEKPKSGSPVLCLSANGNWVPGVDKCTVRLGRSRPTHVTYPSLPHCHQMHKRHKSATLFWPDRMLCCVVHCKIGFGEGSITGGNPLAHIGSSGVYRSQALGGTALATEYLTYFAPARKLSTMARCEVDTAKYLPTTPQIPNRHT